MALMNANSQRAFFYKCRDAVVNLERSVTNQIYNVLIENDTKVLILNKPFAVFKFNGKNYQQDAIKVVSVDYYNPLPTVMFTFESDVTFPIPVRDADIIADFVELFGEVLESIEYGVLD
jgi:hypothetical protein